MPNPDIKRIGPNLSEEGTCALWIVGEHLDKTKTYYICAEGKRWVSIYCGTPTPLRRAGRNKKMMIRVKYDGAYSCDGTPVTTPSGVPYSPDDDFAALTITVTNGSPPTTSDTSVTLADESLMEGADDA